MNTTPEFTMQLAIKSESPPTPKSPEEVKVPSYKRGRPPTAEEAAQGTLWVLDEKSADEVAAEQATECELEAQRQKAAFLLELTQLSLKYQLRVSGCGCCGSPYLTKSDKPGQYIADDDDLQWVE